MPINWDPLEELDSLAAATLNAKLLAASTGVNALAEEDIADGAFSDRHLPSFVPYPDMTFTTDESVEQNPVAAVTITSATFVPVTDGLGTTLQVLFSGIELGMANANRIAALLVLFDFELLSVLDGGAWPPDGDSKAAIALQWQDSGAAWNTIDRTIRFKRHRFPTAGLNTPQNMAVRTLITEADLGGGTIQGVRAVVRYDSNGGVAAAAPQVTFRRGRVSVLPFHAGDP